MHKVDILLPAYNGEKYIIEQINSLLQQSYKNIKIFIRDDGSTDSTVNIIQSFADKDNRIVFNTDLPKNLGLVSNIEYLLNLSDANYVMFCDQDDVWFDNKIELLLNEMLLHENNLGTLTPILVHSDCYVTDGFLNIKGLFKSSKPLNYGLSNSLFKFYVQGSSSMINKALKTQIFPFIKNTYLHDRYLHLVAEVVGSRFYINQPLMYYRQHSTNLVGSSNLIGKIRNSFLLENFVFYQKKDKLLIEALYYEKFPNNELLEAYLKMTSKNITLLNKIKLKKKYGISMRFKELLIMIFSSGSSKF